MHIQIQRCNICVATVRTYVRMYVYTVCVYNNHSSLTLQDSTPCGRQKGQKVREKKETHNEMTLNTCVKAGTSTVSLQNTTYSLVRICSCSSVILFDTNGS